MTIKSMETWLGLDRTGNLTTFNRSLVPTEPPSQTSFCYPLFKYGTKTLAPRMGLELTTSEVQSDALTNLENS